jgi:uncharacterized protein YecT (DUF1311 family)
LVYITVTEREKNMNVCIKAALLAALAFAVNGTASAAGENDANPCKSPEVEQGITAALIDCQNYDIEIADKALNAEYKRVMAKLAPEEKKALRAKERAWIKARDKACARDPEGGTASILNSGGCVLEWTRNRTAELSKM